MKEHPILFSNEMVRAILGGQKTQTRRVITPQPECLYLWYGCEDGMQFWTNDQHQGEKGNPESRKSPYGVVGDRLWVREMLRRDTETNFTMYDVYRTNVLWNGKQPAVYPLTWGWKNDVLPARFMPRWASRISLEIVSVKVQRVKQLTLKDMQAEGVSVLDHEFVPLWDRLNAKHGYPWSSNPWVWVIEFKRIEREGS